MTDKFFDKYGKYAILIARLLPFISFDAISYAAGLTEMSFWAFFWATGVGQLPATIVYSILGQNIGNIAKMGLWIFSGVVALIVFAIAVKKYLMDKKIKRIKLRLIMKIYKSQKNSRIRDIVFKGNMSLILYYFKGLDGYLALI